MSFESIHSGLAGVLASWAGDPEVRARIVTRAWASVVGEQVARRTTGAGRRRFGRCPGSFSTA